MRRIVPTLGLLASLSLTASAQAPHQHAAPAADAGGTHAKLDDLQWQIMVPELGADGPLLQQHPLPYALPLEPAEAA